MHKALVVGGSGFIGHAVIERLLVRNCPFLNLDYQKPGLEYVARHSLSFDLLTDKLPDNYWQSIGVIFYLAGVSDIETCDSNAQLSISANILGFVNFLMQIPDPSKVHLVYASSIYAAGSYGGYYRCSKQAAENYLIEFSRKTGMDYTVLRIGSVYGPNSTERNLITKTIMNCLEEKYPIHLVTDNRERSYLYVDDVARYIVDESPKFSGRIIEVTGQEPALPMATIVKKISEVLNVENMSFSEQPEDRFYTLGSLHYETTPYSEPHAVMRADFAGEYVRFEDGVARIACCLKK